MELPKLNWDDVWNTVKSAAVTAIKVNHELQLTGCNSPDPAPPDDDDKKCQQDTVAAYDVVLRNDSEQRIRVMLTSAIAKDQIDSANAQYHAACVEQTFADANLAANRIDTSPQPPPPTKCDHNELPDDRYQACVDKEKEQWAHAEAERIQGELSMALSADDGRARVCRLSPQR
jgi:hypothetical protein